MHLVDALLPNGTGKIRRDVLKRSLLAASAENGRQQRRSGRPT
jgi:hypothetical protein